MHCPFEVVNICIRRVVAWEGENYLINAENYISQFGDQSQTLPFRSCVGLMHTLFMVILNTFSDNFS